MLAQVAAIVRISYGSAQSIVYDYLGCHKVCVCWVPKKANGAGVVSWATEKLPFGWDKESHWVIPDLHHCTGDYVKKWLMHL